MPLLDSGSGSDLFKDDGTYSGFFLAFASNGRSNVKINVIGYEVSEIRRRRRSTSAEVQTTDEPSFMRTASGGVFKVHSYTANPSDTIAPSRIHDLISESFSYDNSTVTLVWTAVGDDMDQGTAYSYDLRYSTNFSEVRDDFNRSHLVSQEQVLYGNLSHVNASGTTESVTITLPQKGEDIVYYFGIRAWDEAGNGGDLSNIVSLSIRFIPVALPTAVMPTMHATDVMTEIITTSSPSETTVSEEPEPLERTTQQEVPETTKATEPTGPEAQAVIIGLSCALSVVTIIAAVSLVMLVYIYYLKQTPTSVKPITPPKSAWAQQELADIEMEQKDPSYMRKILV
ncbi:calcium-activated chloride channel regulator 1-like [Lytechinus variegatus]|uniref:calcium-activated chloride channel regulator 1-like n=1 Tax=Lytechinus variegatus TaxID=7654 RepID=UPI001BB2260B|nr:calcium-activated chloride channel regulator 1-like [Lytechinus variegatus]